MPTTEKHYSAHFRQDFIRNLRLDFFDEEEIETLLRHLDSLDQAIRQKTFALCHSLSHASSSLVPNTLMRVERASRILSPPDLERWITHAYDLLDHEGIGPFITFLSRIDEGTLREFRAPRGLPLREVVHVLETYLRGLSGREMKIGQSATPFTDTVTAHLPPAIDRYAERVRNYTIFKFTASFQWAQISRGTLLPAESLLRPFLGKEAPEHPDIGTLFGQFSERDLAIDLYTVLEGIRLEAFLTRELPGLMREMRLIKEDFLGLLPGLSVSSTKEALIEGVFRLYLLGRADNKTPAILMPSAGEIGALIGAADAGGSLRLLHRLYEMAVNLEGSYVSRPLPLLGTIRPDEVSLQIRAGRRLRDQKIEGLISCLITMPEFEPQPMEYRRKAPHDLQADPLKEYLLIRGKAIEVDEELRNVIDRRGGVPGGILVSGADVGGASPVTLRHLMDEADVPNTSEGGVPYDEWDYKRGGYKKKWCTLHEKIVHPGHEPFVEQTRARYSGSISILKKKFELLRREPRIIRRQQDGDDFDLDATVEAFTDMKAGISPRDDVFTRHDRQERDIAVLFLLDMSGSTKGWISEAEKEALVLMAEALESLGDSYAIFGFSGMTRTRCDFYRIKGFEEPYAETVQRRISGIRPKDYTRMGPPIRHAVHILRDTEARTKLLITLSDGRPEDYDAYRGDYAVEDTRKALAEARERGVHPFCITIDRDAGPYLRHMYGETNYIIIDDVRQLPNRITEIYRRLTV